MRTRFDVHARLRFGVGTRFGFTSDALRFQPSHLFRFAEGSFDTSVFLGALSGGTSSFGFEPDALFGFAMSDRFQLASSRSFGLSTRRLFRLERVELTGRCSFGFKSRNFRCRALLEFATRGGDLCFRALGGFTVRE